MSIRDRLNNHHIVQGLSLVILIIIVTVFIFPAINSIQTKILNSKAKLLEDIEAATGLKITYENMSPMILDFVELYNVKLSGENNLSSAKVSRIVLDINFLSLIFNNNTSESPILLESVILIDGYLTLHHKDLLFIEKMTNGGYSTDLFKTKIVSKKMDFNLNLGDMEFNFSDIKGSFKNNLSRYYLNISSGLAFRNSMDLPFKWIKSDMKFKGYLSQDFRNIKSRVSLSSVVSDIGKIDNQYFDGEFSSGDFTFTNLNKVNKYDYKIKYSMFLNELYFSSALSSFEIENLFVPDETFELFDQFIDSSATGSVKGVYNFNEKTFLYNFLGRLELINTGLPDNVVLDVHTIGDLEEITLYYLNTSTSRGHFSFNGVVNLNNLFPQGRLKVKNLQVSENLKLNSSIDINVLNSNFISAKIGFIEVGGVIFKDIPSLIYIDDKDISFQALKKDNIGKISISGNYNRLDGVISSLLNVEKWETEIFKDLIPVEPVKDILSEAYLNLNGAMSFNSNAFEYNIKKLEISDRKDKTLLTINGRGSNRGFNIDQLSLNTEDINLIGRVDANISDENIEVELDTLFNENKYNFKIAIDDKNVKVIGSYGFDMNLVLGDSRYLNISAVNFPVNYKGFKLNPTLKLKGVLFKDKKFLLSMPLFNTKIIHDFFNTPPEISLSMDGSEDDLTIYNINYNDGNTPIKGTLNLLKKDVNKFSLSASLKGNEREIYTLESLLFLDKKEIDLDLDFKNSILSRFQIKGLRGGASCNLKLSGTKKEFNLKGTLNSDGFNYKGNTGAGKLNISANESLISITDTALNYNSNKYTVPLMTYNLRAGQLLGQIDTGFNVGSFKLWNNMTLDFTVSPIDSILDFNSSTYSKINGKLTIGEMYSNDKLLFSNKVIRIFNNRSALQVYSADDNLKLLYSHRTGLFNFKISKPYFAEFTANGWLKDDSLDIDIRDINLDAELLEIYIPLIPDKSKQIADFDNLDIRGQLQIKGSKTDPLINGLLWIDSNINAAYIPHNIKPVRLFVRVDNNMVTLLPGQISVGDKGLINIKGEFPIDGWKPEYILIETKIDEENKIPVNYQYNRIVGESNIHTENLKILWQPSGTVVNGNMTISDGEFYTAEAEDIKSEESLSKNDKSDYIIDILINSGHNNKLYLPNKNFPIVEAVAQSGDQIKVDYNSTDLSFKVVGEVSIMQGKVEYSGKPFILRKGEVKLNLSPDNVDPYIFIEGSNTVFDENDQQVEVILTYEGGFYSDFKPSFSSDPIKSEEEILRLIGVAVVGDDWKDLVSSADLLTSAFVSKPLEDAIQKILGVDYVKIKSGFLSSIITNISFEQESDLEYNDEDNLSRILNDTSLSIGNFITKDFFVRGTVGTTYGDNKLGMEVDFDLTLYSPHFQLGFNMKPRVTETSFTPEFGLTLGWVYSPEN